MAKLKNRHKHKGFRFSVSPTPSQNTPNFRHVFTPDYLHKTDSNAQNI